LPPSSAYCQGTYTCASLEKFGAIASFADITEIDPLEQVDPVKYYRRVAIAASQGLSVPENLHELLDRFLSISDDDQERFVRVVFGLTTPAGCQLTLSPPHLRPWSAPWRLCCLRNTRSETVRSVSALSERGDTSVERVPRRVRTDGPEVSSKQNGALLWIPLQVAQGGRLSYLDRGALHL